MTTEAPPRVVVSCENESCTRKDGKRHVLTVVTTAYAVIEQTCHYCRTPNTRIIVDGIVIESKGTGYA